MTRRWYSFFSLLPILTAVKLYYCNTGLMPQCVLFVGSFLRQEDMKFGFVKIKNYTTFDMSAFAFSTFGTIDVKHLERCVGSTCFPSTVTIICCENVGSSFTWLPCSQYIKGECSYSVYYHFDKTQIIFRASPGH